MAQLTPKQQYEASLQAILQVVMDMPQLTDGDWKTISDHTGVLWKLRDRLDAIQEQRVIILDNRYYRERVRQTPASQMMSAQEKAVSDKYIACPYCKRTIKITYWDTHIVETVVCSSIKLALEMEKRYLNSKVAWKRKIHDFFNAHRKTFQVINYFVQHRKIQKNPSGLWWVYNLNDCVFDNVKYNPFRHSILSI
jgi:hypothetical protein